MVVPRRRRAEQVLRWAALGEGSGEPDFRYRFRPDLGKMPLWQYLAEQMATSQSRPAPAVERNPGAMEQSPSCLSGALREGRKFAHRARRSAG